MQSRLRPGGLHTTRDNYAIRILDHVIKPGSGGHDAWGFRNKTVPASTNIVAIGDSQTYGASAAAKDSWPSTLQRISKLSVYNLALGGYGPVQYFHLLTTYATKLKPKIIIVGFYFGNDLLETYRIVHNNKHWQYLRRDGSSRFDSGGDGFFAKRSPAARRFASVACKILAYEK